MQLLETIQVLQKWGKYVVQQSRSNLTKGKKNVNKALYKSIGYNVLDAKNNTSMTFKMLDYGKFQDKGVRGANAYYADPATSGSPFSFKSSSKIPPVKPLADWAKAKRIRLRDEKGKFTKGNYNTIGFLIARSIRDKGIKASLFFTKPYERAFVKYDKEFAVAIATDIGNEIVRQHTEK